MWYQRLLHYKADNQNYWKVSKQILFNPNPSPNPSSNAKIIHTERVLDDILKFKLNA